MIIYICKEEFSLTSCSHVISEVWAFFSPCGTLGICCFRMHLLILVGWAVVLTYCSGPFQFRASIIILASTSKFSNLLIDSDHRNVTASVYFKFFNHALHLITSLLPLKQSIKLFISQVTHGNYDYKSKISPAIAMEDVSREVKILRALSGHDDLLYFYDAY